MIITEENIPYVQHYSGCETGSTTDEQNAENAWTLQAAVCKYCFLLFWRKNILFSHVAVENGLL